MTPPTDPPPPADETRRIVVYLAGNLGRSPRFVDETESLGRLMAASGIGLVYGGARVGLMNVLADTVLAHRGEVIGVIPRHLVYQEVAHEGLSHMYAVDTMHERKHKMQSLAHACLALPGGLGTLEEIFEALAWAQIELHEKPCVFANIDGYYDDLFRFLDHATAQGLILPRNRHLVRQAPTAAAALATIRTVWAGEDAEMSQILEEFRR